ncbi:MAG: large conductance mechanosensitive channel protein MscL [Betaproteobacteria bacterium]|nr:large conductance mechanosensitive channel protein MscL [Betaproteobacteria bacterium]
MSFIQEFKEFALKGNVVDLAVGVIIGGAFGKIVDSLVKDVVMPLVGRLLGGVDFAYLYINLGNTAYNSLEAAEKAGAPLLKYGVFINTVVNFLIVAMSIFIAIRAMNRLQRKIMAPEPEPATEAPATPEDILLLREIRDSLKK